MMRRFRYLVVLLVICLVSLTSYYGYTATIQTADYTVKHIEGDVKGTKLAKLHLILQSTAKGKNVYSDVSLDGTVKKNGDNYLEGIFGNREFNPILKTDAKDFLRSDETLSEDDDYLYGIRTAEQELELKMWDKQTKRLTEMTLPFPSTVKTGYGTGSVRVIDRMDKTLYIQVDAYRKNHETNQLMQVDYQQKKIKPIRLASPAIKKNEFRNYLTAGPDRVIYVQQFIDENNDSEIQETYLEDDGKHVRPIEKLNKTNQSFVAMGNGERLIAYNENEETNELQWTVYDTATKQVTTDAIKLEAAEKKMGSIDEAFADNQFYFVSKMNASDYQIRVVDILSGDVIYVGQIRDKNQVKSSAVITSFFGY